MHKLVTIPYGSRLYGTFDENSDHDWKILYLPDIEDLLVGAPIRNKFFSSASSTVKNTSEDTDTELIALQTFARDVLEGQTYALELAYGIMQCHQIKGIDVHDYRIFIFVRLLLSKFLTSNINAMVGYAYNQAQLYSAKGDRLDKLHQFKQFIVTAMVQCNLRVEDKLGLVMSYCQSPMYPADQLAVMFDKLCSLTTTPNPDGSSQLCFNVLEKLYPEGISIDEAFRRIDLNIQKYGKRANQAMINEGKDWKAISHAVRITHEALDVLNKRHIELPFPRFLVDQLIAIKYGRVEWEIVQQQLITNIDKIKQDQLTSVLKPKTPELQQEFEEFLREEMMLFYNQGD